MTPFIVSMIAITGETFLLGWACYFSSWRYKMGFIVVNMVATAVYAPIMISLPILGLSVNVGSIFYVFVLLTVAAVCYQHGRHAALAAAGTVVFAIITWTLLQLVTSELASFIRSPQRIFMSVSPVQPRIVIASTTAFVISSSALIAIVSTAPRRLVIYVPALIVAQVLDSIIFYPVAFPIGVLPVIMDRVFDGLLFKAVVTVGVGVPLVALLYWRGTVVVKNGRIPKDERDL